jgi:hypothetical protein
MPSRLFDPAVRVRLAGVDVTSSSRHWSGARTGLAVAFNVTKTMTSSPDSATVRIEGLGPDKRGVMRSIWSELGAATLEIWAGWDGAPTIQIFSGDVRDLVVPSRGDAPVTATADDGGDAIAEALVSCSSLGLTAENMIDLALAAVERHELQHHPDRPRPIAKHPSVGAAVASSIAAPQLFRVVSVSKAAELLDEAARILGVRWWLREGLLYMAARGAPTDPVAVALPRTHWLDEPAEDKDGLLRIPALFSPLLVPGRQVTIQGRSTPWSSEPYRCEAVDHAGDWGSDEPWSSALVARRVG